MYRLPLFFRKREKWRLSLMSHASLITGCGLRRSSRERIKNTEELYIHPQSWYDERGIEIIHANAERIDTEKKNIVLSDGNTVPYDTAVIATGSEARSFPIPGRDKNIYVLRKASDAEKLREALRS